MLHQTTWWPLLRAFQYAFAWAKGAGQICCSWVVLQDDAAALTASSPLPGAAPGRAGVRGARDQLSWLIRTTYISTDSKVNCQLVVTTEALFSSRVGALT